MAPLPVLDAIEQRILGALIEKQRTVPASYPLSLNSLRLACNQTSSRDPVSDYDERSLEETCRELKKRELLRIVWGEKRGSRTPKYHQLLDERLSLQPDERALIAVLLLRGPQAPGELRTRTERLHPFQDRDAVEAVLRRMAGLPEPLVTQLPRRPGQQDHRWAHLLGPAPAAAASASEQPAVDREVVLAGGAAARDRAVAAAYDAVAESYQAAFGDELQHKPFEVWLLERVAALAGDRPIVDVGCGPGHIAAFLADTGATVSGVDVSPGMVAVAQREYPDLDFGVGNLQRLLRPRTAPAWGAVVAWYSMVHLASSELTAAVDAMARTLAPGGWLCLAAHAGHEVRHVADFLGHEVELDFVLQDPDEMLAAVRAAGLTDLEWYRRSPVPQEAQTERLYVLARRPTGH